MKKIILPLIIVSFVSLGISSDIVQAQRLGGFVTFNPSHSSREILPVRRPTSQTPTTALRDTDVIMSNLVGITPNTNFGGWTGDYFLEYYVPAADGFVTSIDFNFTDLPNVTGGSFDVAIFEANYPWQEINTESIADAAPDGHLGYFHDFDSLDVVGSNWVQGGINELDGAISDFEYNPLGNQIWPEFGVSNVVLEPNVDDAGWVNVDLVTLNGEPAYFERGAAIIVVVKLRGFPEGGEASEYRMGFMSVMNHVEPQPSMKFYNTVANPEGRTGASDWGWFIRSYVWDWSLNATLVGGPHIVINMDRIYTTLSTAPQTCTATISDGNPDGIASASVFYIVNGGEALSVSMTNTGDIYAGDIPGQVPGSSITHWVEAISLNGNTSVSESNTYSIFEATQPILLVYDTDELIGLEWYYMHATPDTFANNYDLWEQKFGPVTTELVNHYEMVYHVMGGGPYNYPSSVSSVYANWLALGTEEAPRSLFLSGQDYGIFTSWIDSTFQPWTFENAYLGIEQIGPQDVNYEGTPESYMDPYAIDAVSGDALTGFMHDYLGDSLQMYYEPLREIGMNNWIDNLTPTSSATICLADPNQDGAAVAVYNSGPGWKTAFWALDPLGLNYYSPLDTSSMYHWALTSVGNPVTNTFQWFGAPRYSTVGIDQPLTIPQGFKLHPCYPNPFNPVTNIVYELALDADVNITVYNMLGQEIATLINGYQTAGNYIVHWNGLNSVGLPLASGLYFYQMISQDFQSTQKMMLLK